MKSIAVKLTLFRRARDFSMIIVVIFSHMTHNMSINCSKIVCRYKKMNQMFMGNLRKAKIVDGYL